MTARFSQMHNTSAINSSMLNNNSYYIRKSHSQTRPSSQLGKNPARKNIKQNTQNLQGEILDIDEEIAMLQDCLLNVSQRSQMCKSAQRIEQTPV